MNAQQKVTEYAETKRNGMDLQKFVVEMQGGTVIERTPSSKTVAKLTREGRELVVTETTITETTQIVDGKLVHGKSETATEIIRVEL